jgi:chemotaxis protein CheX
MGLAGLTPDAVRSDVTRIVQDIFLAMLFMEVEAGAESAGDWSPPVVAASVRLCGPWNGAVSIECSEATARELTAAMLGIRKPPALDDDVRDVMGELINMLAGNFKALLGGASLSLPCVTLGTAGAGRVVARLGFRTPAGPIQVLLMESVGGRPAEAKK